MGGNLTALIHVGGRKRFGTLALLSLIAAVSEGLGFVLLVPLLAHAMGEGSADPAPFDFALPDLALGWLLVGFVVLVTLRALAEAMRRLAVQDLREAVVDGLRMRAVEGVLAARWRWLASLRRGGAEALLITNIDRAGYGVEMVAGLVRLALALVALGLAAMTISPAAALTGGAAGALVLLGFSPLRRRARRLGEALSRAYDRLQGRLGEVLAGLRVIKSYGRENRTSEELSSELKELRKLERAYVKDTAAAHAALQVGGAALAAAFAYFAIFTLAMPLEILLPLGAIFVRALPLISELQTLWQGWRHAGPAIEDALELIEEASEAREPVAGAEAPRLARAIELRGVSIAHRQQRPALANVDLTIAARELLVLTGPSGSGKSTLADLTAGLIAPDLGDIRIDGVQLTPEARRGWRARVAYVQQEPVLFSGSVRDNLAWAAPDADEESMHRALEEAAAHFVFALPQGIDCDLGEGGRALSGGERQRIALARALMRNPDLIVLDEATSAVDAASEQAIAAALHAMTEKRTVIAVAHRGLLPEIADRVVRLDAGRIAQG